MLSASYVKQFFFFLSFYLSIVWLLLCFAVRRTYLFILTWCFETRNKYGLHTVPLTITISIKVYTKGIFKSLDKTLICQWHARSITCSLCMHVSIVCVLKRNTACTHWFCVTSRNLNNGKTFKLHEYMEKPVSWRVLKINE